MSRRSKMAETTLITGKYQVTLPKRVREALGAGIGDRLTFVKGEDGFWRILVVPKDPVKALRLAGRALTPADFARLHQEYERESEDAYRD
jgi:AbrB family looped-hinge helix DNA binding protein